MLDKLGIRYDIHPDGPPLVLWQDVTNRGARQAATTQHEPEPNFEALLKRGKKPQ